MKWWQKLLMELTELEVADFERRLTEVEISIAWGKWFRRERGQA